MPFVHITLMICAITMSAAWLSISPFKEHLWLPTWTFYGAVALYSIGVSFIVTSHYSSEGFITQSTITLISASFVAIILISGIIATRENAFQYVFTLMTIMCVYDTAQVAARMMTDKLVKVFVGTSYLTVLLVCVLLMILPAFIALCIIIKNLISPIIFSTARQGFWKYQWLIPVLFVTVFRMRIFSNSSDAQLDGTLYNAFILFEWFVFEITSFVIMLLGILRTRRAAHDLRHHFIVIDSLAEKGDCDGIRKYLQANSQNFGEPEMPPVCDNYSVNSVLCHHISEAKKTGHRGEN